MYYSTKNSTFSTVFLLANGVLLRLRILKTFARESFFNGIRTAFASANGVLPSIGFRMTMKKCIIQRKIVHLVLFFCSPTESFCVSAIKPNECLFYSVLFLYMYFNCCIFFFRFDDKQTYVSLASMHNLQALSF